MRQILFLHRCGIIPVDRTQYPTARFNAILKNRYDTWLDEGKKDLSADELDALFEGAFKEKPNSGSSNLEDSSISNGTMRAGEVDYNGKFYFHF